jgi:hypothetical protein
VDQPDGAEIAVTDVVAAAVTAKTRRSPAVRGCEPENVCVEAFAPLVVV